MPLPLSWRPAGDCDLPAITELAGVCLAADGGQPFAASPGFLSRRYLGHAESWAGFAGARLICVTSLRRDPPGSPGDVRGAVVTTGLVHPACRRRGIGGHAFDWARRQAGESKVRAETETLSDGAHALYLSQGLVQVFAEDVLQLAATVPPPSVPPPGGLALSSWREAGPARFYTVYRAAFRERPGFPGWSQAQWTEWISDDEDFRAEWTLLATRNGDDVAFIAGAATGLVVQLGVVPAARGRGIGAYLTAEVVRRMRAAGETTITLDVNINNPHAAALYRSLGFTQAGRRARYEAAS